eukprot:5705020-Prymnesium_polylepis.1
MPCSRAERVRSRRRSENKPTESQRLPCASGQLGSSPSHACTWPHVKHTHTHTHSKEASRGRRDSRVATSDEPEPAADSRWRRSLETGWVVVRARIRHSWACFAGWRPGWRMDQRPPRRHSPGWLMSVVHTCVLAVAGRPYPNDIFTPP